MLNDLCHVGVTAHARCETCGWEATEPNHGSALNLAARHIESEGHHCVDVRTAQYDVVMGAPDFPKYREQRVLR